MVVALVIIIGLMAFALLMFVLLVRRIAPLVFMLMRVQASNAETMNDLLNVIEDVELPAVQVKEFEAIKDRVSRLERAATAKPTTRTRKKVTA